MSPELDLVYNNIQETSTEALPEPHLLLAKFITDQEGIKIPQDIFLEIDKNEIWQQREQYFFHRVYVTLPAQLAKGLSKIF